MTLERALSVLSFLLLVGFLGVLIWRVPRLDLGAVAAITVLLCAYDLFVHRTDVRRS